jgi:tetratricopeptide (TPR) repeat protein
MHYRWFARYQLVAASDGHPWAADLLYAYGKSLEKDAELNPARANMFRGQAVVCYQAAMQIAPTQSEVANQLGFALIHLDRMEDAYTALAASIQHKPNANAWNNLAEIYRRRGSHADAEYAVQQATALSAGIPKYTAENPEITELDPAVFAKYSPKPTMAMSTQSFDPNSAPSTVPNAYGADVRSAKSSNSLFSKIFKK